MAYDLHGGWEKFTGENAPLHPRGAEHGDQRQLNVVCINILSADFISVREMDTL